MVPFPTNLPNSLFISAQQVNQTITCWDGKDMDWDTWFHSPKTKGMVGTVFAVYTVVLIIIVYLCRKRYKMQISTVEAGQKRDLEMLASRR